MNLSTLETLKKYKNFHFEGTHLVGGWITTTMCNSKLSKTDTVPFANLPSIINQQNPLRVNKSTKSITT